MSNGRTPIGERIACNVCFWCTRLGYIDTMNAFRKVLLIAARSQHSMWLVVFVFGLNYSIETLETCSLKWFLSCLSLCMIWFIMENFLSSYRCTHSMESQKTCCITLKYIQFRCPTERQRNEPFQSNLAHFECLNSRKIIIFRIYRYKLQRSNAFKCICFFVPKIDANWFNWDAWHTLNFRNW